jgi:hypothetical protein
MPGSGSRSGYFVQPGTGPRKYFKAFSPTKNIRNRDFSQELESGACYFLIINLIMNNFSPLSCDEVDCIAPQWAMTEYEVQCGLGRCCGSG